MNDYRSGLTIADLSLIFRNIQTGKYGELYGALNPPKILGWFSQYFSERMNICENNSNTQHSQRKESRNEPRNSETSIKGFLKDLDNG